MNRTAAREAGQGPHIGVLFAIMREAVAQIHLIAVAEGVINATRGVIGACLVVKQAAVSLELIHQKRTQWAAGWIDRQDIVQDSRAYVGGKGRLARQSKDRTSTETGETADDGYLIVVRRILRSKDIGVGQQRHGILRVLDQSFKRHVAEGLVGFDRETGAGAELFTAEMVLDRLAGHIRQRGIESLSGLQSI